MYRTALKNWVWVWVENVFLLSHILFSQELNWIIHIANPLKYATYFNLLDLEIYVNDCKEVHCFFGVVVVVVIVVVVV